MLILVYIAVIWALAAFAIPSSLCSKDQYPLFENSTTEIFQVYKPGLAPVTKTPRPADDFTGEACSAILLHHEFVNSYGHPAVAPYTPPPASCKWNTVYFHLYTTSKGRQ